MRTSTSPCQVVIILISPRQIALTSTATAAGLNILSIHQTNEDGNRIVFQFLAVGYSCVVKLFIEIIINCLWYVVALFFIILIHRVWNIITVIMSIVNGWLMMLRYNRLMNGNFRTVILFFILLFSLLMQFLPSSFQLRRSQISTHSKLRCNELCTS